MRRSEPTGASHPRWHIAGEPIALGSFITGRKLPGGIGAASRCRVRFADGWHYGTAGSSRKPSRDRQGATGGTAGLPSSVGGTGSASGVLGGTAGLSSSVGGRRCRFRFADVCERCRVRFADDWKRRRVSFADDWKRRRVSIADVWERCRLRSADRWKTPSPVGKGQVRGPLINSTGVEPRQRARRELRSWTRRRASETQHNTTRAEWRNWQTLGT